MRMTTRDREWQEARLLECATQGHNLRKLGLKVSVNIGHCPVRMADFAEVYIVDSAQTRWEPVGHRKVYSAMGWPIAAAGLIEYTRKFLNDYASWK